MTRPTVHAATEAVYDRLPEHYRERDLELAQGTSGYPLLRYLSLPGDQLGEVLDLFDRANYITPDDGGLPGDTSDLVDPATAEAAWLPWLAQLVGAQLPATLDVPAQRDAIAGGVAGFLKGTKTGIAAAAQSALTGTRYVRVNPNYTGDQWKIEVRTRTSETASTAAVLAAIVDAGAKPAGYEIVVTTYEATWDDITAGRPTWADWEAGTWTDLEETGAP